MKLLIDMNLSPQLVTLLQDAGFNSTHWSEIGDPRATDRKIMEWARKHDYWIITNDLDFGDILAATDALCPSVIQIRTQDLSPNHLNPILHSIVHQYKSYLEEGALIVVDEARSRIRMLPIRLS